jgi:hypothetical protein
VWLNPESDVIYFGPKTCLGGLIAFLKLGLPIQRIAFDAEARFDGNYCSRDCYHATIAGKTCLQPILGHQVDSLVSRLRILHGFNIAGSNENIFPGCPSLEEVLLFMKTPGPFDPEIRDVRAEGWWDYSDPPDYVDFQRYTTDRPHYPLIGLVRMSIDAYTDQLLATTLSSFSEKNSAWKGGKQVPKFQLARFSKSLPAGYIFKLLLLNFSDEGQYTTFWWNVCQIRNGAIISKFPATYSGPGTYVLKLMGPGTLVALHTTEIMEKVREAQALYNQEIKIVEPKLVGFSANLGILPMGTYLGIGDWQQSVQNDGWHI